MSDVIEKLADAIKERFEDKGYISWEEGAHLLINAVGLTPELASALAEGRAVCVPREPTDAMLDAAWEATKGTGREDRMAACLASAEDAHRHKMRKRYAAMVRAHAGPSEDEATEIWQKFGRWAADRAASQTKESET